MSRDRALLFAAALNASLLTIVLGVTASSTVGRFGATAASGVAAFALYAALRP